MSAIFGIFRKSGETVAKDTLSAMRAPLAGWGTERQGVWKEGPAGLGHLLSADTPECAFERQPIVREGFALVADARIDNREELAPVLELPANASFPDSEFIFRAWLRWGEECPHHLLGDYAFAIWDLERRSLFCARDHIGARPFFYHDGPECFVFGSDLRAVLAVTEVPERANEEFVMLNCMVGAQCLTHGRTAFRDIARLRPGHVLFANSHQTKVPRYWRPDRVPRRSFSSPDEMAADLRPLLEEAVRCRLRSAGPVSAHLSGGLDSTAVTLLAKDLLKGSPHPLRQVFSWSPPFSAVPRLEEDERDRIEQICNSADLECFWTEITPDSLRTAFLERDVFREFRYAWIHELSVSEQARDRGIRTILSGWGGDEGITFPGPPHIWWELTWRGKWKDLWRGVTFRTRLDNGSRVANLLRMAFWHPLKTRLLYWTGRINLPSHFRQAASGLAPEEVPIFRKALRLTHHPRASVRAAQLWRIVGSGHLERRLESWAVLGARTGISYRYPWLDRRVLEFALALQPKCYIWDGRNRLPLRHALSDLLPGDLLQGTKPSEPALIKHHQSAMAKTPALPSTGYTLADRWIRRQRLAGKSIDKPEVT